MKHYADSSQEQTRYTCRCSKRHPIPAAVGDTHTCGCGRTATRVAAPYGARVEIAEKPKRKN